ncbi:DUF2339 domain-containing protein [Pararhodobacter zhoushanensis]|uniref:DUF2339 domain-containing protein n=1 Tax=Pararhodobacter zhoushanensis TaxID=2479545 RepID=UPI000F8F277A|nr:DUF2339 domain-containing protein [Pararhodobacter zhoushanensis]
MFESLTLVIALCAAGLVWLALQRLRNLSDRVAQLEAQLAAQPGQGDGQQATQPASRAPWRPVPAAKAQTPTVDTVPKRDFTAPLRSLVAWMRANWIYPVAGLALVMAGIYLVQYSIDKGLLSPKARIGLALASGAGLILAAEGLRRRWGASARQVPATLAGGGIAALLAGVLAAHHLYDLLGPEATLIALCLISALSIALGWMHGPILAAMGVLAGAAAPFLLGEGGAPRPILYGYFAVIAAMGLAIDGLRRWGWISALAVVAPLAGGVLIHAANAPADGLALLTLFVVFLALALPGGALIPRATGPMVQQWRKARPKPEVLVAALAVVVGAGIIVTRIKAPEGILAAGALALLVPLWTRRAPALDSLSLVAALALPLAVASSLTTTPLLLAFVLNAYGWLPQTAVAFAALAGLAMVARSDAAEAPRRTLWALLAVATPGATAIAVELFWQPQTLLGFGWPATIMALAAGLTALTLWFARRDNGQGGRLGVAGAAAITMIALALMLVLSAAALTVALAVLMVASAAMDRRFGIPSLGWVLGLGAMTMGWRLVVDPGLQPLMTGSYGAVDTGLTLLAVLAGPLVSVALIRAMPAHAARDWGRIICETALSGIVPIVVTVLLARMFSDITDHATLGIQAATLIALSRVQLLRAQRLQGSVAMTRVRKLLALLLALAAALWIVVLCTLVSPLLGGGLFGSDLVVGWPILNDLALAYGLPALMVWIAARDGTGRLAKAGRVVAVLLGAVWCGHMIRHLWQGASGMQLRHGFAQGEIYAYTVALLVAGAVVMAMALYHGRVQYRRLGLVLIALAAAKAFLIDAAGLSELMRAGAFLGLGLSLAGLAWLNAWISARMGEHDAAEGGD